MNIRLRAGALAFALLACVCAPALAQDDARKYGGQDVNLMSKVTGQTIGDSPDRPLYVSGGGGGGGGGGAVTISDGSFTTFGSRVDAPATSDDATATYMALTKRGLASQTAANGYLSSIASAATGARAVTQSGAWNVAVTGSVAATQSGTWSFGLPIGASTSALQNTANGYLSTLAAASSSASTSALQTTANGYLATIANSVVSTDPQTVSGSDGAAAHVLRTSTSGGLLPGQATPTSTRTTLTASTITTIDTARSGRLIATVQLDGSPSAPVYLCFSGQAATCSDTVYDLKIASGGADGALYSTPFGSTGAIYAYSTAAAVLNVSSWLAQ